MKYFLLFAAGFLLAVVLIVICNLPNIRRSRRKRKEELQQHPERKGGTTKVLLFSILMTYYIAFAVGVWVVIFKDVYQLDFNPRSREGSDSKYRQNQPSFFIYIH